jgi:hypothetical protein
MRRLAVSNTRSRVICATGINFVRCQRLLSTLATSLRVSLMICAAHPGTCSVICCDHVESIFRVRSWVVNVPLNSVGRASVSGNGHWAESTCALAEVCHKRPTSTISGAVRFIRMDCRARLVQNDKLRRSTALCRFVNGKIGSVGPGASCDGAINLPYIAKGVDLLTETIVNG